MTSLRTPSPLYKEITLHPSGPNFIFESDIKILDYMVIGMAMHTIEYEVHIAKYLCVDLIPYHHVQGLA